MAVRPRTCRLDLLGQDQVEQIRHREVARVLKKMSLSPEEEEAVKRLSHSLVTQLLTGPIAAARARGEGKAFYKKQGGARTVSR